MQKISSWRELLESITNNTSEREPIATEIGVRPITLTRWASGESTPRSHNLHHLLNALPKQYRNQFRTLVGEDLLSASEEETLSEELPYKFVNEVLNTRANIPDALRYWTISRQVLQHMLRHLDPEPIGMSITVVRCMPPTSDGKIHSLRESVGLGSSPWEGD